MYFWRMPGIAMGEVQEVGETKETSKVIKRKFSIKIVQKQMPDRISSLVQDHIRKVSSEMGLKNKVTTVTKSFTRPWIQNYKKDCYEAARRATIQIYKKEPNMVREDKDNVQINILQKLIDKPYLKLPLVNNETNPNGNNENISLKNFIEGTKLLAAFMLQMHEVGSKSKR